MRSKPTLNHVLKSPRDVLGEWSMGHRDGPRLSHFNDFTSPLRCVNAPWVYYPIPLGFPGMEKRFRLVADGSEVHIGTDFDRPREGLDGYNIWYGVTRKIAVAVGRRTAPFGRNRSGLADPVLKDGCLPVYRIAYTRGKTQYQLECFAADVAGLRRRHVIALRLSSSRRDDRFVFSFSGDAVRCAGGLVTDADDRLVALVRGGVMTKKNTVVVDGSEALLVAPIEPVKLEAESFLCRVAGRLDDTVSTLAFHTWARELASRASYEDLRDRTLEWWRDKLSAGRIPDVPEAYVQQAARTVLLNVHSLMEGDQLNYSLGNMYQRPYSGESGIPAVCLGYFGYRDESRRALEALLFYHQKGMAFSSIGLNLISCSRYYSLYRDRGFALRHAELFLAYMERIAMHRHRDAWGLLPKEKFCGDIATPVYNLRNNAVCWRGMRDMAGILSSCGVGEAEQYTAEAKAYRGDILQAVRSCRTSRGGKTFVPIGLKPGNDAEVGRGGHDGDPATGKASSLADMGPYDVLFESTMGGYYSLLFGYLLGTGVLSGTELEQQVLDYVHESGGVAAGMVRWRAYADYTHHAYLHGMDLDDPYTCGYAECLIKRGDWGRALVSLYGKLGIGYTPNTFFSGEGSYLKAGEGRPGRDMLLPPNSMGDGFFLNTLRHCLVTEVASSPDGREDTLLLTPAVPRAWLNPGRTLSVAEMPTAFGPLSYQVRSEPDFLNVTLRMPDRDPYTAARVFLRVPRARQIESVEGPGGPSFDSETKSVDLAGVPRGENVTLTVCYRGRRRKRR